MRPQRPIVYEPCPPLGPSHLAVVIRGPASEDARGACGFTKLASRDFESLALGSYILLRTERPNHVWSLAFVPGHPGIASTEVGRRHRCALGPVHTARRAYFIETFNARLRDELFDGETGRGLDRPRELAAALHRRPATHVDRLLGSNSRGVRASPRRIAGYAPRLAPPALRPLVPRAALN